MVQFQKSCLLMFSSMFTSQIGSLRPFSLMPERFFTSRSINHLQFALTCSMKLSRTTFPVQSSHIFIVGGSSPRDHIGPHWVHEPSQVVHPLWPHKTRLAPEDVDLLIHATSTPDDLFGSGPQATMEVGLDLIGRMDGS